MSREEDARNNAESLAERLRQLWELARLERPDMSLEHIEWALDLATSTLSAWLKGKNAPSKGKEQDYLALVSYLQDLVPEHSRRRIEAWKQDLEAARFESRARKTGRPPKKATNEGVFLAVYEDLVAESLAPDDLEGRKAELAALTAFARQKGGGKAGYWWWRAQPWAGKTALMATFIRKIASSRTADVVSYFISATHRGEPGAGADRKDFLRQVTDQLAAIVDQPNSRRPRLTRTTPRDSRLLLALYKEAAAVSRERGRTLLLVVDGLDGEDATGESQSIAPLLPKPVPPGMRVLVTSRTTPFVPDVEPDHPLRDPQVVKALTPSPKALAIRDRARTELYRLLKCPVGCKILGMMAVAHGGLSIDNLDELFNDQDVTPLQIDETLRGVKGRSMSPEALGPETYVLAHRELREAALERIGRISIQAHGDRLRTWAESYAERGWPEETPPYLLSGYATLLSRDGDVERLRALVLDPRRQYRMAMSSRTDLALSELDNLADLARGIGGDERLGLLAAVAASRHFLGEQQPSVPRILPSAFALLGDIDRALALARSPGSVEGKAARLADVAGVLVEAQDARAAETAREAAFWVSKCRQPIVPSFVDEGVFGPTVVNTAIALIATGQKQDALSLLRAVNAYGPAVPAAARAAAALRPHDLAGAAEILDGLEDWAEAIAEEDGRGQDLPVEIWAEIAQADPDRAERLYDRIKNHVKAQDPEILAFAASTLAEILPETARSLATTAVNTLTAILSTADATPLPVQLPRMLARTVRAMVDTGDTLEEAKRFLGTITDLDLGFDVTRSAHFALDETDADADADAATDSALLSQMGTMKEQDRIPEARGELERLLSEVRGHQDIPVWLPALAEAAAFCGMDETAAKLAAYMPDDAGRARLFAAVSAGCSGAGRHEAPLRHSAVAESLLSPADPADALDAVAQALALVGKTASAQALVGFPTGETRGTRHETEHRSTVIAAGLRAHRPDDAEGIVRARLLQLGPSGSRFTPLHELAALLLGVETTAADTYGRLQDVLLKKLQRQPQRKFDDLLVQAILCISDEGYGDVQSPLEELERQATSASAHPLRIAGYAVVLALLGDFAAAGRVAQRLGGGEAFAAAAGQAAGIPVLLADAHGGTDNVTTTIRALAHFLVPQAPRNIEQAQKFLQESLNGSGWHHALTPLARSAPTSIAEVLRITEIHLGDDPSSSNLMKP
ncbi:hypothetical protein GCM10027589_12890 [Actinocorallia lasiicapitis]